jgi:hypothetical protein
LRWSLMRIVCETISTRCVTTMNSSTILAL